MQKLFFFELATAIKDRPKGFQIITLVLFAFSLTMILIGTIARLTAIGSNHQEVFQKDQVNSYTDFTSSASPSSVHLQK